jgi:hypothetical protein
MSLTPCPKRIQGTVEFLQHQLLQALYIDTWIKYPLYLGQHIFGKPVVTEETV